MKRVMAFSLLVLFSISFLFSAEGRYQWVYDESTYDSSRSDLNGAKAETNAVITAEIIPSYMEIGFLKSDTAGNFYDPESENLYEESITLEDADLDGVATGPGDLYVYYKVLSIDSLDILVSLSGDLAYSTKSKSIPWNVSFTDTSNSANKVEISSGETKEDDLYSHDAKANYSIGVFKVDIKTENYESISNAEDDEIPSGVYKADLIIEVKTGE